MKTSIIILTHDNLNYTQMCINSIMKYTDKGTYEIIVVDNNSGDGTVQWLKEQQYIRTIFNNENYGFPKGCNQGIEISEGENILLLNNDTIVTKNWLNNMTKCLYSNINIGAVGCVTNNCSNYQTIECNYETIEEMFDFSEKYNISNEELWEEKVRLIGFCMLIKKVVVNEVGLLDEIFTPGNFEDDDYSYRIIKSGYKLFLCKDTFIHHFGSVSFKENPQEYSETMKINQKKFLNKWGFDSNDSSKIRYDVIEQIKEPLDMPINVLEIGCGCGATLLKIRDVYKNSSVYGLEVNKYSAEIAKCTSDVVCSNIEKAELSFEKNFFNYIILGDELEHTNDPCSVLINFKKYLKKDGNIISSIMIPASDEEKEVM